jgi:hypothetical protein
MIIFNFMVVLTIQLGNAESANTESANTESANAESANVERLRTPNQRTLKVCEHRISKCKKSQRQF